MTKQKRAICALTVLTALASELASPFSFAAQVQYAYDPQGRVIEATYDNGVDIVYSYDAAGNRISQVVFVPPSNATLSAVDASASNYNCPSNISSVDPTANYSKEIACFPHPIAQYSINPNASGGVTVSGPEGVLTVANVVLLVFGNDSTFTTTSHLYVLNQDQASIARLYRTMFSLQSGQPGQNAPNKSAPDVQGLISTTAGALGWYTLYETLPAYMRANPASGVLQPIPANTGSFDLVDSLSGGPSYQQNYANLPDTTEGNTTFITALFWNALNRAPTAGDLSYWVGAMTNSGLTKQDAIALISTSAEAVVDSQWQPSDTRAVPGWIMMLSSVGS